MAGETSTTLEAQLSMGFPGPFLAVTPLSVRGLEVTQAIQRYRAFEHLTDPTDHAPDNSVRLVANKTAWVRVYVRSGPLATSPSIPNVTGTLTVFRRHLGFIDPLAPEPGWQAVATLDPEPPGKVTARADPAYITERSTLSRTLNFAVPADVFCGRLRLVADITAPDPGGGTLEARSATDVNATMRQTLRVAGVLIAYDGPDGTGGGTLNLAAPTLQDLQATCAWTLKTQPLSRAVFRVVDGFTWDEPLTDQPTSPGRCSQNWIDLNNRIQGAKTADGNQWGWIYYGLLPAGTPVGPITGCESGVSSGRAGDQVAMCHEIGHGLGLAHAPCMVTGDTVDPAFPTYPPYPSASIGEFGLDIDNGAVLDPFFTRDYMSYCAPRWVSLYHQGVLEYHPMLDPTAICLEDGGWDDWRDMHVFVPPWEKVGPPWEGVVSPGFDSGPFMEHVPVRAEPIISLIGTIDPAGRVSVRSVARVAARPVVDRGVLTDLTAQLLDRSGSPIAEAPVYALPSHAGCCEGEDGSAGRRPRAFQAMVPDKAPGEALRVVAGDEERWRRDAPRTPPRVEIVTATVEGDRLAISWRARTADRTEPEIWIRWSADGEAWLGLATGISGDVASLGLTGVPPGEVVFQVLAHDGFHTAEARTEPLRVPERAPSVAILHPQTGHRVPAGRTIRLAGSVAALAEAAEIEPPQARWLIDGEEVARGLEATAVAPSPGEHICTLLVEWGGGAVEVRSDFISLAVEERPPEEA
jgi:hypothetical protein